MEGFVFDTVKFQLTVPEVKLARAAKAVEDMLERRHGLVLTKELASVAGLLGSFNLAMGSVTRFHTRGMMTKLVEVTELWGWSGKLVLGERVVEELRFWKENMVAMNGHRMRKEDKVILARTAEMFSDAGEFMMAGAQFAVARWFQAPGTRSISRSRRAESPAPLGS